MSAQFPGSRLVPDAMFLQAVTFLEMNRREEAVRVFQEITLPWILTHGGPVNATMTLSIYTYKIAFETWIDLFLQYPHLP